jgi:hypothetical protein
MPKDASAGSAGACRLRVRAYVPPRTLDGKKASAISKFVEDLSSTYPGWIVVVRDQDAVLQDIYSKSFFPTYFYGQTHEDLLNPSGKIELIKN